MQWQSEQLCDDWSCRFVQGVTCVLNDYPLVLAVIMGGNPGYDYKQHVADETRQFLQSVIDGDVARRRPRNAPLPRA